MEQANATWESAEDQLAREIRDIENYLEFLKEKQRQIKVIGRMALEETVTPERLIEWEGY